MNEKQKKVMDKIGLVAYMSIKKGLDMAEASPTKKVFHSTKNKNTLREKFFIEELYPNLQIFTEEEWLQYAYNHLSPEEQKKVAKKIRDQQEVKKILEGE
jgi:hypothetical protein